MFLFVATSILVVVSIGAIRLYRSACGFHNFFDGSGLVVLPNPRPFIGHLRQYFRKDVDVWKGDLQMIQKYGKVFGYFEGAQPCICVGDLELVRQVMIKDFESFVDHRNFLRPPKQHHKPGAPLVSKEQPMEVALNALTGNRWRHVRQQMTPAFSPAALRRIQRHISRSADQLAGNMEKWAKSKSDVDIKFCSSCYTVDVIAAVTISHQLDTLNDPQHPVLNQALQFFGASFSLDSWVAAVVFAFPAVVNLLLKLPSLSRNRAFFHDMLEKEIEQRRAENDSKKQYDDVLGMIMDLEKDVGAPENASQLEFDEVNRPWLKNGLTHSEIIGQCMVFLLAGFETTANTLANTLMALSMHPEYQERLYDELNGKPDGCLELPYLDACITETLRLYTPVLRTDRLCTKDTEVGGFKVKKGVDVIIPMHAIHHDPDLWDEPEFFQPDRFMSIEEDERGLRKLPFEFLGFGAGNRNCIGMRLALMELKMALSMLVKKFRFSLSPDMTLPIEWKSGLLRQPVKPIMLRVAERS